jgi:hypothetical protein
VRYLHGRGLIHVEHLEAELVSVLSRAIAFDETYFSFDCYRLGLMRKLLSRISVREFEGQVQTEKAPPRPPHPTPSRQTDYANKNTACARMPLEDSTEPVQ